MALAKVIHELASGSPPAPKPVTYMVENFASYLARHPATHPVELVAPSSWSCAHGVERWRAECGCKIAPDRPSQQKWRAVLRDTMDWLAGEIHTIYQREASPLLDDPWAARDDYDPSSRGTHDGANQRVRELLELERHALMIYTSCAWFFDDIAGIEPIQNLKYAARAIELTGKDSSRLEAELLRRLAGAQSNDPSEGSGRDIYLHRVKPRVPAEARLAGGMALTSSWGISPDVAQARAFETRGSQSGPDGYLVKLRHRRTGRENQFRIALLETELEVGLVGASLDRSLGWRLIEGDLWDRHRDLLRHARIHRLFAEIVDAGERDHLIKGDWDRAEATRMGAGRAIEAAVTGGDAEVQRALRALELLDLFGLSIPFDAQTAFGHALRAADPELMGRLAHLAWRLGFVKD